MYQSPRRSTTVYKPSVTSAMSKRRATLIIVVSLVVGVCLFLFFQRHHQTDGSTNQITSSNKTTDGKPAPAGFNKKQHSTTDAASLWIVVNKQHQLKPKDYTPDNLVVPNIPLRSNITSTEKYVRADMATALEKMVKDAAAGGVKFNLQSGYRSYSFQVNLYNGYVKQQGQATADRQSARPGYSEHQTGLAADLGGVTQPACNVAQCFAKTPEGAWLAANAHTYGFIVRYGADDEETTGYDYEPWHIRYVGIELAAEMHRKGIQTLEEFFDISGGTAY